MRVSRGGGGGVGGHLRVEDKDAADGGVLAAEREELIDTMVVRRTLRIRLHVAEVARAP